MHEVFARAYVTAAIRPALAIPVAALLAGAMACLLLRSARAAGRAREAPVAAPAPAGAGGDGDAPRRQR
jgi:hypothetical protein